jgi:hypothetical protein
MPRFALTIELGNAAMRNETHVAAALLRELGAIAAGEERGIIRDLNGNTVGSWTVDYPPADDDGGGS